MARARKRWTPPSIFRHSLSWRQTSSGNGRGEIKVPYVYRIRTSSKMVPCTPTWCALRYVTGEIFWIPSAGSRCFRQESSAEWSSEFPKSWPSELSVSEPVHSFEISKCVTLLTGRLMLSSPSRDPSVGSFCPYSMQSRRTGHIHFRNTLYARYRYTLMAPMRPLEKDRYRDVLPLSSVPPVEPSFSLLLPSSVDNISLSRSVTRSWQWLIGAVYRILVQKSLHTS